MLKLVGQPEGSANKLQGIGQYLFFGLAGIVAFGSLILSLGCNGFGSVVALLGLVPLLYFKDCPCFFEDPM